MERVHLLQSERDRGNELERRVEERTAELTQTYKKLEREVADRAKVEDQLRQSQKMEAIGTLAGGIAHDFNNILAAIIGFSEMIEEDLPQGDPSIPHVQRVLKAAHRGKDLVQQILAFSRKTRQSRHAVSLSSLAKETVVLLRASLPTTIELVLDITTTSDAILATHLEVQQVLMNLATNAAFSMRENKGLLHVSITDIDIEPNSPILEGNMVPGEYVRLAVTDTGIGMTPEVMKRIFEPFFTTGGADQSTGMGLAVVYGIVKSLHGGIMVESEPGVGSSFQIFFPKVLIHTDTGTPQCEQNPRGTERILFIDDEESLVEWGETFLKRLGYDVIAMNDSAEALHIFASDPSRFDLVITDQTMPGITGSHLARELLKIRPDIPIILCTGHSDVVSPEEAKQAGIKEFLMKPVAGQALAKVIRNVLYKKHGK
jgi:signal transduction histidine kinase/ActR/RegA family two-component response regulator